jgi:bifunctional non-homologous end joining protein LigD
MIGARVKVDDRREGLHVVLPLQRVHTWDEVEGFAKGLADHLVRLIPRPLRGDKSKQKPHKKIYVIWDR